MTTKVWQLTTLGQSLWYDNIERRLLENGELAAMVERGEIRGLTSNPSIFNNAIAKSNYYDSALYPMAWAGYNVQQIIEHLMVEDIKRAADLLRPLYETTHGGDGFVSLEVRPDLAYDTETTASEAQRLWTTVNTPNLMIKIPATKPGLAAIRQSIAAGININITLIFSISRYQEVMDAYLSGLEDRLNAGEPIDQINSVASFFVSRIDSKVDKYLESIVNKSGTQAGPARALIGKIAIANARLAYQEFRKVFESERFTRLQSMGANIQRPLWASTSTKNPSFPDTLYVDELIGAHTVNTVPPQTLIAFKDHGIIQATIEKNIEDAQEDFQKLEALGISMLKVTQELEEEGVEAFSTSFDSLESTVKQRREGALRDMGSLVGFIPKRIAQLEAEDFTKRLFSKDPSIWTDDPKEQAEIRIRMGWFVLPGAGIALLPELEKFVSEIQETGYTHALLLGMGGSSLAPEIMSLIFGDSVTGLKLTILDSTNAEQVLRAARQNPPAKTLYLVSSKSGGTVEVNALFNYFWGRAQRSAGSKAGEHFIAITDPGTSLEKLAIEHKFRRVILANPEVGGRFSALSVFGLIPAALMGINVGDLLRCASWMASECSPDQPMGRNPGIVLGAVMGEAFLLGRDKLTVVADTELVSFGSWLEQLVAESSGKQGKGIVPIQGEPFTRPAEYGSDRLFYYLRRSGEHDNKISRIRNAGHPVITQQMEDNSAIASEFYKWEIAIATACAILGVNPFDQPDVQDSKNRTMAKVAYYQLHRNFNESVPVIQEPGVSLYGDLPEVGGDIPQQVRNFLKLGVPGDYVAINAFLDREKRVEASLLKLRKWVIKKTKLATTVGFGPRFLHSTGQLHKGGANNGLFLVLTSNPAQDVEIPGQDLGFGTLQYGQALGDLEALGLRKRRILHVHFSNPDILSAFVTRVIQE